MKKILITALLLAGISATAQVKVGSNPTSLATDANFQVEATNGQQFFINKPDGKVGIGTTTPTAKFEVVGAPSSTLGRLYNDTKKAEFNFYTNAGSAYLTLTSASSSMPTLQFYTHNGGIETGTRTQTTAGAALGGLSAWAVDETNAFRIGGRLYFANIGGVTSTSAPGVFFLNTTEVGKVSDETRLYIDSYGNTEIGNSTQTNQKLFITGERQTTGFTNDASLVFKQGAVERARIITKQTAVATNANTLSLQTINAPGTDYIDQITIDGLSNKVGIGTTTPTEKLDVAGSIKMVDGNQGAGKLMVSDAAGKATWTPAATALGASASKWTNDATNTRVALTNLSDGTTARTAGTEFVVTDAGNVGIGTVSPRGTETDETGSEPFSRLELAGRGGKSADLIVSTEGDHFPNMSYRRFNGITKTNRSWTTGITSAGDFLISDRGDDANPVNLFAIYIKKGTAQLGVNVTTQTAMMEATNYIASAPYNLTLNGSIDMLRLRYQGSNHFVVKSNGALGVNVSNSLSLADFYSFLTINGYAKLGSTDALADAATADKREGMIRYTTANGLQYHTATNWVDIAKASDLASFDSTKDAWTNDSANGRVKLQTYSDGITSRVAGTQFNVTDSGSVAIGLENPTSKFDVNGAGNFRGSLNVGDAATSLYTTKISIWDNTSNPDINNLTEGSTAGSLIQSYLSGHMVMGIRENDVLDAFSIVSGGGNWSSDQIYDKNIATFRADGNVGIGTTAPTEKLMLSNSGVNDGGTIKIQLQNPTSVVSSRVNLTAGNVDADEPYFAVEVRDNLTPFNVTEKMRVLHNGNVGIGTAVPTSKLSVVGLPVLPLQAVAGVPTAGYSLGDFYHTGDGIVRVMF